MKLVVASPVPRSAAYLALKAEGLEPQEAVLKTSTAYGALFSGLWKAQEPFILCEWDVIPWPGACEGLWDCEEPWCAMRYPLAPTSWAASFGINKITPQGQPQPGWVEQKWSWLDGAVVPTLIRLYHHAHLHEPPAAHARRESGHDHI